MCWPRRCGWFGGRQLREGTQQQHELPALLFGEAFFEGRHRLVAFAELVEEFTVGDNAHVSCIGEVCRRGIVQGSIVPITLSGVAVARGTFVTIEWPDRLQNGTGTCHGILALLGFFRHGPGAILHDREADGGRDDDQQKREKRFAYSEILRRPRSHDVRTNFRTLVTAVKDEWRQVCSLTARGQNLQRCAASKS